MREYDAHTNTPNTIHMHCIAYEKNAYIYYYSIYNSIYGVVVGVPSIETFITR